MFFISEETIIANKLNPNNPIPLEYLRADFKLDEYGQTMAILKDDNSQERATITAESDGPLCIKAPNYLGETQVHLWDDGGFHIFVFDENQNCRKSFYVDKSGELTIFP